MAWEDLHEDEEWGTAGIERRYVLRGPQQGRTRRRFRTFFARRNVRVEFDIETYRSLRCCGKARRHSRSHITILQPWSPRSVAMQPKTARPNGWGGDRNHLKGLDGDRSIVDVQLLGSSNVSASISPRASSPQFSGMQVQATPAPQQPTIVDFAYP